MALCYSSVGALCSIVLLSVIFIGLTTPNVVSAEQLYFRASPPAPSADFSRHSLVKPKVYHGREKRQISSTRDEDGLHLNSLTIGYVSEGTEHVLDLRLNRELVPSDFFVKYQHNGKHQINRPTGKDLELCHYVGVVRDLKNSWAAISTCHGLRGVVYDGTAMHYLQPSDDSDIESDHFLYKHEDLISNHTCGYQSGSMSGNETHHHQQHPGYEHHDHHDQHQEHHGSPTTPHSTADGLVMGAKHEEFNRILRYKRQASDEPKIRGPYNANKQSRYVELVLVVDNKEYKDLGESLSKVHHHCKDIANIINSLYAPLNIFVALIGVVVWTEFDEITLSENGDNTLTAFLHYRREKLIKDHPNDNAQLLTREQFVGGVVGKALKGPICTYEFSGGVAMDHSSVVGLVATTVAHEMGHNFGMEHDTEACHCPDERCIMSPSSNALSPTHWSSCSLEYLALAFEHGMDYCLRNKPTRLFDSPVCGNGFVESGEQCDCGLSKNCDNNHCCDPATCMLFPNATCATGECCDLETCRPSSAGSMCRTADHECDLPEFCTGQSEFCPDDVFKMDTETCDHGKAFCYHGSCRTRSDQCRLLWGPSGESSDDQCYEMNKKGSRHGNCGYNRLKKYFSTCQEDNVFCGMLHCRHLNERLEFGMESVAILSHSFINSRGSIIPCRTAIVDLGLNQVDPGLVPDGAMCGEGKMCVNQKCMAVASLRLGAQARTDSGAVCPSDCSGHGVCNSLGHCHCEKGFAPPLCKLPGPGGSLDSGPASDPHAQKQITRALLIFFLGIVPSVLLVILFFYYSRQNSIMFWKKPKGSANKSPTKNNIQRGISRPSCFGLSSPSPPSSSSPLSNTLSAPALSPDDMNSSLLPSQTPTGSDIPSLNNHFFGQFKGFTLFPIQKREESFGNANQNFAIENEQNNPATVSSFTNGPTSPNKGSTVKNAVNSLNRNANQTAQINRAPSFNNMPKSPNNSQKFPQRSAPPVPSVPTVAIKIPNIHRSNTHAADAAKRGTTLDRSVTEVHRPKSVATGVENANSTSVAPALPPSNPGLHNARPIISNPILEASTCTAKELISPLKNSSGSGGSVVVPLRAAPTVPLAMSPTANKRPLSSPNSTTNAVFIIPEEPIVKKPKEGNNTLNRIASFLKQDKSADKEKSRNPVERSNSLPKNPNHLVKINKNIDKNALRNLHISNPILQKDIDIPSNSVPVVSDSEDLDDPAKMVVMRAQSMRGPVLAPRPVIPTFGSMRQASGVKRPTSIPVGNRPTSPPPPRPNELPNVKGNKDIVKKIPGMPGYQNPPMLGRNHQDNKSPEYDDCVAETHAPLANISEETSPDNIYAIIEESPPNSYPKQFGKKNPLSVVGSKTNPLPTPNSQHKTPENGGKVTSGSADSMGLLGEIVSEIQNRNFDSIYSTSTLARKKKEKEMREKNGIMSDEDTDFDDASTYANTSHYKSPGSEYSNVNGLKSLSSAASTTSSGYLNPSAVNVPVGKIPPKSGIVSIDKVDTKTFEPKLSTAPASEKIEPYKPFSSSLHRSLGPFASSYSKEKTPTLLNAAVTESKPPEKSITSPLSLTQKTTTNSKVPMLARQNTPDKLLDRPGLNRQITPPNLKNLPLSQSSKTTPPSPKTSKATNRLSSSSTSGVNSPDLVSSCTPTSGVKSPDVVSGNGSSSVPKTTNVNQGVILKPTLQMAQPAKPLTQIQKAAAINNLKPLIKQLSKTGVNTPADQKSGLRSAPAPPSNLADKKKSAPVRPTPPKVIQNSAADKNNSTTNSSLSSKSNSFEKNLSNSGKTNNASDAGKVKPAPKSVATSKIETGLKSNLSTVLPSKPSLTSKVSNVANLQQKFETSKLGQGATKVPITGIKKV